MNNVKYEIAAVFPFNIAINKITFDKIILKNQ